jgi:Flp pilus assembly protein TadG
MVSLSGQAQYGVRLLPQRSGAVALEFAILAVPFLIMFMGVLEIGYDFFVQEALDAAVETTARGVQVGSTQGTAKETSANLVAAVCPNLSGLLNCNQLTVAVGPVAAGASNNYYNASPAFTYAYASGAGYVCTGVGGQLMLLAAWYNGPSFLGVLVPGFAIGDGNGGLIHRSYAQAGFVNEYFSGGQTSGNGC